MAFEKSTDAEIELRIATVYEMVVKGCSRKYIVRYCAENYKIESRQVDVYLKRVHDEIKENFSKEDKEKLISNCLARLNDLYVKSYIIEDFRECRNIIETESKLIGLNAPTLKAVDFTDKTESPKEPVRIIFEKK